MPQFVTLLVLDERLRRQRFYSALLIFAAILIMGSIPGARAEIGNFGSGLVLHSVAYACLTFLMHTGMAGTPRQRALKALLGVAVMGACDELVQSMLSYRVGSFSDWIVDCSAALVTASLLWAFLPEPVPPGQPQG